MKCFHEMLRRVTSSPYHDRMLRFAAPLNDHFGINHFWYYKITFSGNYCYLGSHSAWSEFCFEKAMVSQFPCLRDPNTLQKGITLMKASANAEYKLVLDTAWKKFRINFNINLINTIPEGIEAFGFASRFNDSHADQRLLTNLPLLRYFTNVFRKEHKKLFQLIDDNQINLPNQFGPQFYENSITPVIPNNRDEFLRKMGFASILSLTPREIDVLKLISNGYPASYIAKQVHLGKRTVENYIATIKCKLACDSKVELIQKAQEIASTGYFS